MQHRTHVPKFGNWEANASTPAYTAVVDVARAEKGGKMMNPRRRRWIGVNRLNNLGDILMETPSWRPPGEVPPNRQHGDSARYAARGGGAGGLARAVPSEPGHRCGVVDRDSNHNSDRSNGERSSTDGSSGRSAHRGGGRGGCPPTWDPRRRVPSGDDISTPGTPSKSRLSAGIGRPEEPVGLERNPCSVLLSGCDVHNFGSVLSSCLKTRRWVG